MGHLVRKVTCLAAVLLPCAEGHLFGRLGRKPHPDMSAMSVSAVDGQLALQKGSCHDAWAGGLSTQCPAGAVMALKGHSTMVGLAVSVSRCEPVGCLHSPYAQQGGGGNASVSLHAYHNDVFGVWHTCLRCEYMPQSAYSIVVGCYRTLRRVVGRERTATGRRVRNGR